jgi:NADH dehydrogenase/NADH:ubiquinone oxidoreductase subunit G
MQSELSANVVDLCPVGALTSKPYVFEARPWELKKTETIDVMDAIGSNIRVDTYDWEVKRVLPIINEDINEEWISDKTRYACDGLLNQRLDTPFIKYNGKFEKASWEEVYKIIKSKFENTSKEKVCGFVGDLTNMETGSIAVQYTGMDGLNIYGGTGTIGNAANDTDVDTYGVKYAWGPVTVGYQRSETDLVAANSDLTQTMYSVAFAVNDNLSISYGNQETEKDGSSTDQKVSGFSIGYSMGGMTIKAHNNKGENIANQTANESEHTEIAVSFAF